MSKNLKEKTYKANQKPFEPEQVFEILKSFKKYFKFKENGTTDGLKKRNPIAENNTKYWSVEKTCRELIKLMEHSTKGKRLYQLFSGFVEYCIWTGAMRKYDSRVQVEFDTEDIELFHKMLESITNGMIDFSDVVGELYMELSSKVGKQYMGQFFTPEPIAELMSRIVGIGRSSSIEGKQLNIGDISGCGSGRMLLAAARMHGDRVRNSHYVGTDLDHLCVKMTVFNMYCYSIPGVVFHENSLTGEIFHIYEVNKFRLNGRFMPFIRKFSEEQVKSVVTTRNNVLLKNKPSVAKVSNKEVTPKPKAPKQSKPKVTKSPKPPKNRNQGLLF